MNTIFLNTFSQSTMKSVCNFVNTYDSVMMLQSSSLKSVMTSAEIYGLFVSACQPVDVGQPTGNVLINDVICRVGANLKCYVHNPYSANIGCEHTNITLENNRRRDAWLAFALFKKTHEMETMQQIPDDIMFGLFKTQCIAFMDEYDAIAPASIPVTRQYKIHAPPQHCLLTQVTDKGVVITDVDGNSYFISNDEIELFLVPV